MARPLRVVRPSSTWRVRASRVRRALPAPTAAARAAAAAARPGNIQSFTHVFALEHVPGDDFTIDRPHWQAFRARFASPVIPTRDGDRRPRGLRGRRAHRGASMTVTTTRKNPIEIDLDRLGRTGRNEEREKN